MTVTPSPFDGLARRSHDTFGKPVAELTRDQLARLYRDAGIMPPAKPDLRIVRDQETQ